MDHRIVQGPWAKPSGPPQRRERLPAPFAAPIDRALAWLEISAVAVVVMAFSALTVFLLLLVRGQPG